MKIKKLLFIFLLVPFLVQSVSSQSRSPRQKLGGEFIFGGNLSSLDFVGDNTYNKLRLGFQLGFLADYQFIPNVFVQTGFIMMKKGGMKHYKYDRQGDDGVAYQRNSKLIFDANYMYIPLSIGFRYPLSNQVEVAATAGGYFAYGFKGFVKQEGTIYTAGVGSSDNIGSIDIFKDSLFKRFDYGLIFSASLYFGQFYFVRLGFEQGFPNVGESQFLTSKNYSLTEVSKIKTISTSLSLGFRF